MASTTKDLFYKLLNEGATPQEASRLSKYTLTEDEAVTADRLYRELHGKRPEGTSTKPKAAVNIENRIAELKKTISMFEPQASQPMVAKQLEALKAELKDLELQAPKPTETKDTAARNLQAQGEAYTGDLRAFAFHLRDLADKGELKDASGKPLSMYSRDKIANMSEAELKKLVDNNPRLASTYFGQPTAETKAALEGTGRTGAGERSNMVAVPEIKPEPIAAPVKKEEQEMPVIEPEDEENVQVAQVLEGTATEGVATPEEKKDLKNIIGDLVKKYGVPILGVIQAGAYGYTGNKEKTLGDQMTEDRMREEEKKFMSKMEADKQAYEQKKMEQERQWQEAQAEVERRWRTSEAELDRMSREEQAGRQLSQQEKLLKMQLEAERAARLPGTAPTVAGYVTGGM